LARQAHHPVPVKRHSDEDSDKTGIPFCKAIERRIAIGRVTAKAVVAITSSKMNCSDQSRS